MIGQELGEMVQDDSAMLTDGYKMTELGPLPEEWQVVRLGKVFEIQQGKSLWTLFASHDGSGNKTTVPNLSHSRLTDFPAALPPLPEQCEIARLLQTVDYRIRAQEGRNEHLEAVLQTLLHNLMTAKRRLGMTCVQQFQGGVRWLCG